ncbi:hypothetical protein SAMN02910369_01621 [Lachnospiraceae bacterium NE2001]|nr:hypothetical protein SAMN02910369_01621 [Lachnospiraceae bacterium NE2001]
MPSSILSKSKNIQKNYKEQADSLNEKLQTDFFNQSVADREKDVSEMLLNYYIINTGKHLNEERKKRSYDAVYNYLSSIGETHLGKKHVDEYTKDIFDEDEDSIYHDFDVVVDAPNGKEVFQILYLDEIKKTDAFKNIITAKNQQELNVAINNAIAETEKGLGAFQNVKLPEVAEEYNAKARKHYDDKVIRVHRRIDSYLADTVWKNELKEYEFNDLHISSLEKNAQLIGDLYKELKSVDYKTSSPNFRSFKRELKNLKKLSEKYAKQGRVISMHEMSEYNKLARKVLEMSDVYLLNKKKINSPYARNRVEMVKSIKKRLSVNTQATISAADSVREELQTYAFGNKMKVIDKYAVISKYNRHVFLGEHKLSELYNSAFSLGRSAGYSISVFVLMNMGYNINDIMDTTKLTKEKAQVFEDVLRRCKSNDPEDNKWLAKQMYDGFKLSDKYLDQAYKKIDFSRKDFYKDDNYALMHNLSIVSFDIYQEMHHVIDEMNKLADEDPTYDREKNPDFSYYRNQRKGIVSMMGDNIDKIREPISQIKLDPSSESVMYVELIKNAVGIKYLHDILKENQNKDISYTDLTVQKNAEVRDMWDTKLNNASYGYSKVLMNEKESTHELLNEILDGTVLNNVTFNPNAKDGKVISGLPTEKELALMAEDHKFLRIAKKKLHHLENDTFSSVEDVDHYVEDAAIVAAAEIYKLSGARPIDEKTNEPISLVTASKRLMKNKSFQKMLRNKKSGKYKNPKAFANEIKDKKTIRRLAYVVSGKPIVKKTAEEYEKSAGSGIGLH